MARFRLSAESATEGQPDKLADWICDGIVDAVIADDAFARVHVEAMITRGFVLVAGEANTRAYVDIGRVVREAIAGAGYRGGVDGFDPGSCGVLTILGEQSAETSVAVDRKQAGDTCIVTGYATREGERLGKGYELMPVPVVLAHRLARRLSEVRREGLVPDLTPDGESLVTVEYEAGTPFRVSQATLAASHREGVDAERLAAELRRIVLIHVLEPTGLLDRDTELTVNPAGTFAHGGPRWDTGITGRKAVSDAYGTHARHGGSALAGKDPTKVDRSGAYGARHAAKNVVAAGLADRCEIQVAYAIGRERPLAVTADTFQTAPLPDASIAAAVEEIFDLTPAGCVDAFDLRRPIYRDLSVFGPFGRPDLPWERLEQVEALQRKLGAGGGKS